MATSIASLPSELLDIILSSLPISSLLALSATSKKYQVLAHKALQTLNLAVFPHDIHCQLALLTQQLRLGIPDDNERVSSNCPSFDCIARTTGSPVKSYSNVKNSAEARTKRISIQNEIAAHILGQRSLRYLKRLVLNTYDIASTELTTVIATKLPQLKHLELNFNHPYIHDQYLSSGYWREAPAGNPCWNALVGLGQTSQHNLRMRNLQSLRIERAGITSAQLRSLLKSNPQLRSIHLNNVTGVDQEFVQWLGIYCEDGQTPLQEIILENCSQLRMQDSEDFAWLAGITAGSVRRLSLSLCRNVNHRRLVEVIEDEDDDEGLGFRDLEVIVTPRGTVYHLGVLEKVHSNVPFHIVYGSADHSSEGTMVNKLEVDPQYLAV